MARQNYGVSRIKTPHRLAAPPVKGSGRRPGKYICTCGEEFTGVTVYERHRAAARKGPADGPERDRA